MCVFVFFVHTISKKERKNRKGANNDPMEFDFNF